jgi:NAD(P)-dependent dehydrogenase (short-subunit alcohol dehydrogenase family)
MQIENKVILVTGGASGLGAACVRLLSQAGAKAVIADLNKEAGTALANEPGTAAVFVPTNVVEDPVAWPPSAG